MRKKRHAIQASLFGPQRNRPTWLDLPTEARGKAIRQISDLLIKHMEQEEEVLAGGRNHE